jgi:hypothetical protein
MNGIKMPSEFSDTFLAHAFSIVKKKRSYSDLVKVQVKHAVTMRLDLPNVKTASLQGQADFLENLSKFPDDVKFKILDELTEGLACILDEEVENFRKALHADYRHLKVNGRAIEFSNSIEKTRHWLERYPKALTQYEKCVEMFEIYGDSRDIVDNTRLCLEIFMKEVLGSEKQWDDLVPEFRKNLKGEITPQFTTMFFHLLNLYKVYQNENAKHNSRVEDNEVSFVFDLSLAFLRIFAQIHSK